jgi:hypothetical protein
MSAPSSDTSVVADLMASSASSGVDSEAFTCSEVAGGISESLADSEVSQALSGTGGSFICAKVAGGICESSATGEIGVLFFLQFRHMPFFVFGMSPDSDQDGLTSNKYDSVNLEGNKEQFTNVHAPLSDMIYVV